MKEVRVAGNMDNSDGTLESANRVYDVTGLAPTVSTCGGVVSRQRLSAKESETAPG